MEPISGVLESIKRNAGNVEFKLNEPLKNHTSFRVGGPVRVMYFPEDTACLVELCKIISGHGITPLVLGNGTNILANDQSHDIVVVNTTKLKGIELTGETEITADSGALLSKTAVFAHDNGLSGLEFAHGIPGTLGGAVVMNAGAYGGEMKDVVSAVNAFNMTCGCFQTTKDELDFSYRCSRFSDTDDVVLSTVINLEKGNKESIRTKMDGFNSRRNESQPLNQPSAGSIFKRPKQGYAAALIDNAGLTGFTIGGAQVSDKHAGFIVNCGNATFSDIMAVIAHVQEVVLKQFDVRLELEIKVIG